jgi:opacity protein-like surface antigen
VWGVQDMWAFSFGADLSRHVGVELALDAYEKNFEPFGFKQGEQSLISLVPQVRLRLPLAQDRIVPYVVAGAGIGWYDFNDPTEAGYGWSFDAQGTKFVISAGLGIDLFLNEHVAFNLEGKYIWLDDIDVRGTPPGGGPTQTGTLNMSDFVGTFGLRAYVDNTQGLPLLDAVEKPPVRIYFIAGFGGGWNVDANWVPGVKLIQESASLGSVGQSIELGFGANFGRHWSFEIPVDYHESAIYFDNVQGITGNVGEFATYSAIPVLRFRYPSRNGNWVPFLMAGAGGMYYELNDKSDVISGFNVGSKGIAFAFSAGAGVEYHFNPDVSIFGQAKYIQSFGNEIEIQGLGEQSGDLSWLHLQLGFRMNLAKIGGRR